MAFPVGPVLAAVGLGAAGWWYWTHWRTLLHATKSYALLLTVTDKSGGGLEKVTSELAYMLGMLDGKNPLGPAITLLGAPAPRDQGQVQQLLAGNPAVFMVAVQANRDVKAGLLLEALGSKVHLDQVQELPVAPSVPSAGSDGVIYYWQVSDPSTKRVAEDIESATRKVGQFLGFSKYGVGASKLTSLGGGRWSGNFAEPNKAITEAQVRNAFAQAQLQLLDWGRQDAPITAPRVSGWSSQARG